MTSSLHLKKSRRPPRPIARTRAGFTLVEMLVVIGIILVLIGVLLPALNSAYKSAVRNRMSADMQVISQALEAYHGDFGDYPRPSATPTAYSGAVMLCWALIAPGPDVGPGSDGALGPGFRLRSYGTTSAAQQGKVYGPYLSPDRFVLGTASVTGVVTAVTSSAFNDTTTVIADRYGNAILYFPAAKSVSAKASFLGSGTMGATPPTSTFNYSDNSAYLTTSPLTTCSLTLSVMRYKLGDTNVDGMINGNETAATNAPYILWSAGPDGKFGPPVDATAMTTTATDDDITYPVLNDVPVGFSPPP